MLKLPRAVPLVRRLGLCSFGRRERLRAERYRCSNSGTFVTPSSSSYSPDAKNRTMSVPPRTCSPCCWRYPVPYGVDSLSSCRLYDVTLSCTHVPAATWVRKHCTVFDRLDVVAAVVPVRQPQKAVG